MEAESGAEGGQQSESEDRTKICGWEREGGGVRGEKQTVDPEVLGLIQLSPTEAGRSESIDRASFHAGLSLVSYHLPEPELSFFSLHR